MSRAIREHLRDFLAIAGLVVVALVGGYIIVQQQRLRIPVLEEKPFRLNADFSTAQAVIPGQGQTVRVAGVRIGDISKVSLKSGRAQVAMDIDRKYLPIYRNATILLRPKTGLKDMFLEMDPGTRSAGEFKEGDTLPIANTAPDVDLDQVLASLDTDTQAYLRTLLVGGGQGLKGRGKDLGDVLKNLGPLNHQLARVNGQVAKRKFQLANLIHNLNILTGAVGSNGQELQRLISNSNSALSAIAAEDPQVRRAVKLLPGALIAARNSLQHTVAYANELGPTFNALRPFAKNLPKVNKSTKALADATTPAIKNQIRPFVRAAQKPVVELRQPARAFTKAAPSLTKLGLQLNVLGNMAAFNPNGANACVGTQGNCIGRDEGYLYWLAYLSHNGDSVFAAQDAHGDYRHLILTLPCGSITTLLGSLQGGAALNGLITGLNNIAGGTC